MELCKIYIRGISKITTVDDITRHFSICGTIVDVIFPQNPVKGYCWIVYENETSATKAVQELNHSKLHEIYLSVRKEDKKNNLLLKSISQRGPRGKSSNYRKRVQVESDTDVFYSSGGIVAGGIEYPFPQGKYVMKLLALCRSSNKYKISQQPLLDILFESNYRNKTMKELSESMAMVNAVSRLFEILNKNSFLITDSCNCSIFVLADGVVPITTTALALFMPPSWRFWAIDPLLNISIDQFGHYAQRIRLFPTNSQDVNLDSIPMVDMNVVIACHSHAPLREFWNRLPGDVDKACISMPCCGNSRVDDFSYMDIPPVLTYDDYEVYSPKRTVKLYYAASNINGMNNSTSDGAVCPVAAVTGECLESTTCSECAKEEV